MIYFWGYNVPCNDQFLDRDENTCEAYSSREWCTIDGNYGRNWNPLWGTWSTLQNKEGEIALTCPQCGCADEATCVDGPCLRLNQDYGHDSNVCNTNFGIFSNAL